MDMILSLQKQPIPAPRAAEAGPLGGPRTIGSVCISVDVCPPPPARG